MENGRKLEPFTQKRGGMQILCADIFMKKKEFEAMFSHDLYRKVRSTYGATNAFPEVYTKVIPEKRLIDLGEKHDCCLFEKQQGRRNFFFF